MELDWSLKYILEDEVVRLSPLMEKHLPLLHDLTLDPAIWTYFLEKGQGGQQYKAYMNNAIAQKKAQKEYPFVVYDKRIQQYAGMTRFYDYSTEIQTIKLGHTWYGKDFRGTGINKHCKYLLFEFAFEELAIERIGFGSYITNKRSIAAMKSIGCKEEGRLRNMFPSINGKGRVDAILLSILKGEWTDYAKAALKSKLIAPSS